MRRATRTAASRRRDVGRFFSSMGRLVASVSQETALLPVGAAGDRMVVVNGPAGGSGKE